MDLFHAMRVFVRVADTQSFTRAAEHLDISVPIVTRTIASLEAHLNVRLLHRTTRRVALSEAGQSYLDGCRAVLAQIDDIETVVAKTDSEARGTLRVVTSTGFALTRIGPWLTAYQKSYPNIVLQVTAMDRPVDLVEEGFDAGILPSDLVRSESWIMRPLLTIPRIAVASPAYLQRAGRPRTVEDLAALAFLAPSQEARPHAWRFSALPGSSDDASVILTPAFSANSSLVLHQVALDGMGFTVLPASMVEADLQLGRLERLLTPAVLSDGDLALQLVYPSRRLINRRLRSFIDHLTGVDTAVAVSRNGSDHGEATMRRDAKPLPARFPAVNVSQRIRRDSAREAVSGCA
jgi:DNA-binding transcriptional LysR family regulator